MIHQTGSGPSRDQSLNDRGDIPYRIFNGVAGVFFRAHQHWLVGQREDRAPTHEMRHFYPRGAFYLACMAAGVVLLLLVYFRSAQFWALWVWLWT
jgi:hypothetical protein